MMFMLTMLLILGAFAAVAVLADLITPPQPAPHEMDTEDEP